MSLIAVIKAMARGVGSSGTTPPPVAAGDFQPADFNEDFEGGVASVPDTTAPTVLFRTATSPTNIRVTYNEAVNASVAGHTFNNGGNLTPSAATQVSAAVVDYTVTGLANGQTITHTYVQQGTGVGTRDTAGNQLAGFSSQAVTNNIQGATTGPQITYAYVEDPLPERIELGFDTNIDSASVPAANRFTVSGGRSVIAVNIGPPWPPNWVNLEVNTPFNPGEPITLSYLKPPSNPLQATDGTDVESFSNYVITNALVGAGDTTPPTVQSMTAISANTIRIVFSEAVIPTISGWTFNNGGSISPSAVTQISGSTWDFSVTGLASGQTITGSYNSTTGNTLDISGNELTTFSSASVTNNVPPAGSGDTLSFTSISYSSAELRRPGAGAEDWQGQNVVDIPTEGAAQLAKDFYARSWFTWAELESLQGVYDFAGVIGPFINLAIDRGQKFGFGIMTIYDDAGENIVFSPQDQGAGMSYPLYVHNNMQALPANERDFIRSGWWIPNYNAAAYLDRLDALHQALNTWLQNNSRNGVNYADAIGYIDIRGFGNYGEWHHAGYVNNANLADGTAGSWPTGRRPTLTTLQRIVDSHCNYLGDFQLVAMIAILDAQRLPNTWNPPGICQYMLQKTYNGGKRIGIRRDNYASTDQFILDWTVDNNRGSFDGQPFSYHIMEQWKFAPINGEPYNFGDGGTGTASDDNEYATLEAEVEQFHVSSFGNGNFVWSPQWSVNSPNKSYVRAASKRAGHRLRLSSGSITASIVRNTPFNLSLTWQNDGVAPTYENWNVNIELRSGSTVVWSAQSSAVLRLFLPGSMLVSDGFTIPSSVAAGTYNLHLIIRNTEWPARLMPLHITGVQGDGSYILRSNKSIT